MWIYLVLLFFIVVYSIVGDVNRNNFRKKTFVIISFGLYTVISMLRKYTVGIDMELIYNPVFESARLLSFSNLNKINIEIGYVYFNKILSLISSDVQVLIIVSSLIIYPIYGWFIYKNSKNVCVSTLLFMTTGIFLMEMNVVRQALAIAVIMIMYEKLKQNKLFESVILIILASFINASAIILLFCITLRNCKFKRSYFISVFIILAVLMIFINPIINLYSNISSTLGLSNNKEYSTYLESEQFGVGYINLASVFDVIYGFYVFVLGYYILNMREIECTKENEYDYFLFMTVLYFIFQVLSLKMNVVSRLTLYFIPFTYIMFPEILTKMKNRRNAQFIEFITIAILIIKYILVLKYRAEMWYGVVPYTFFWN